MGYIVEISRSLSFTYVMNDDGFDWVRLGNTMGWFKLDKKNCHTSDSAVLHRLSFNR